MDNQPKVEVVNQRSELDDLIGGMPARPERGFSSGSIWFNNISHKQYVICMTAINLAGAPPGWQVIYRRIDDPLLKLPFVTSISSFVEEFTLMGD